MKHPGMDNIPCLSLNLRRANRVMNKIYEGYLSAFDVTGGQFSILHMVSVLQPTSSKELQGLLALDQTTLSRNLKPLLRDGLLVATPGEDKRQKLLSLSSAGETLHQQATPAWEKAQQHVQRELGKEQSKLLLKLTRTVAKL